MVREKYTHAVSAEARYFAILVESSRKTSKTSWTMLPVCTVKH